MRSRLRGYDLPALLLLHFPWRCRTCGERVFFLTAGSVKLRLLHQLWMHYVLLGTLGLALTIVMINTSH